MKQGKVNPTFLRLRWTKPLPRSLVTKVLEEYRPEAASLSTDVFDALRSTVGSLVDGGRP